MLSSGSDVHTILKQFSRHWSYASNYIVRKIYGDGVIRKEKYAKIEIQLNILVELGYLELVRVCLTKQKSYVLYKLTDAGKTLISEVK